MSPLTATKGRVDEQNMLPSYKTNNSSSEIIYSLLTEKENAVGAELIKISITEL